MFGKKEIGIVLATLFISAIFSTVAASPVRTMVNLTGDVNNDGIVNDNDIRLMRTALMPGGNITNMPDVNGDGRFYYDDIDSIVYILSNGTG